MSTTGSIEMGCPYCGQPESFHRGKCHLVKAMEYHPNGTLKRVEFFAPVDYRPVQVGVIPGLPDTRSIGSAGPGEDAVYSSPSPGGWR